MNKLEIIKSFLNDTENVIKTYQMYAMIIEGIAIGFDSALEKYNNFFEDQKQMIKDMLMDMLNSMTDESLLITINQISMQRRITQKEADDINNLFNNYAFEHPVSNIKIE